MEKPKVVNRTLLYTGYLDVRQDLLQKNDGEQLPYTYYTLPNDAVVILGLTPDNKFLVTREYRYPPNATLLGCAGGKLEHGEDPIDGGRRELLEETGYASDDIILLGACYPIPALSTQKAHFLLARNVYAHGTQYLDPFEFIKPEIKSKEEIQEEIRKGTPLDSHLMTALSFYHFSFSDL